MIKLLCTVIDFSSNFLFQFLNADLMFSWKAPLYL